MQPLQETGLVANLSNKRELQRGSTTAQAKKNIVAPKLFESKKVSLFQWLCPNLSGGKRKVARTIARTEGCSWIQVYRLAWWNQVSQEYPHDPLVIVQPTYGCKNSPRNLLHPSIFSEYGCATKPDVAVKSKSLHISRILSTYEYHGSWGFVDSAPCPVLSLLFLGWAQVHITICLQTWPVQCTHTAPARRKQLLPWSGDHQVHSWRLQVRHISELNMT